MQDLRLLQIQEKNSFTFGLKEALGTLVSAGILLMIALYTYSKVRTGVDLLSGGTYVNSTDYCPAAGTWNTTDCNGATLTALPEGYNAMENVKSNLTSAFDLSSVAFIVLAAAAIIGIIWLAFR